ncbi:MAG: DNA polymerase ligase N-terminal domain-containing protein [bacterium]
MVYRSKAVKSRAYMDGNKETTGRFVVQEHHATRLHYDFRLEMGSVLRSWAIPKNAPLTKGIKRLAIAVEDHPLDYLDFEGRIPEGQYGAGKVVIWDKGEYLLLNMTKKAIEFAIYGKKLAGSYVLLHFKEKQWLIFKR